MVMVLVITAFRDDGTNQRLSTLALPVKPFCLVTHLFFVFALWDDTALTFVVSVS
jgi:hypothetical protein